MQKPNRASYLPPSLILSVFQEAGKGVVISRPPPCIPTSSVSSGVNHVSDGSARFR
jgi:hypothetical protein